jgi:hypothetical protein
MCKWLKGAGIVMTQNRMAALCTVALAFGAAGQRAAAEVLSVGPNGFEVRESVH